jgi:hypothetical protein
MTTPLGQHALKLAARGMRVFPCIERTKEPAVHDNLRRATTDCNMITGWWSRRNHNIGIATGKLSGVWVLDVDGDDGEATLRKLEAEHGALPATVEAITGNGRHLYFAWPSRIEIRNRQEHEEIAGIHVRGNGGYVIAPPSVHPSGWCYSWSVDSTDKFATAPDWLIALVTAKGGSTGGAATAPREQWLTFLAERVDGSRRRAALARLAGLLLRRYVDPAITIEVCRFFNTLRCDPPLPDEEIVNIVVSIGRREVERRGR